MNFLNKVNALIQATDEPVSEAFKEKVIFEYKCLVLGNLKSIFDIPKNDILLVAELNEFLENTWELVKGTALSYTALPNDELSLLLCEVAEYISTSIEDGKPAIAYLMPSVSLDCLQETQYQVSYLPLEHVLRTHAYLV